MLSRERECAQGTCHAVQTRIKPLPRIGESTVQRENMSPNHSSRADSGDWLGESEIMIKAAPGAHGRT
jgi:hypothetical protein